MRLIPVPKLVSIGLMQSPSLLPPLSLVASYAINDFFTNKSITLKPIPPLVTTPTLTTATLYMSLPTCH